MFVLLFHRIQFVFISGKPLTQKNYAYEKDEITLRLAA
jgi:hypothetical protein